MSPDESNRHLSELAALISKKRDFYNDEHDDRITNKGICEATGLTTTMVSNFFHATDDPDRAGMILFEPFVKILLYFGYHYLEIDSEVNPVLNVAPGDAVPIDVKLCYPQVPGQSLGDCLRGIRNIKQILAQDIADKAAISTRKRLQQIEKNETEPRCGEFIRLATVYDINLWYLPYFGFDGD